jgi:hypothetical protein
LPIDTIRNCIYTIANQTNIHERETTMKKTYMAIDQYGHTEHGLTHPRKDLMDRTGYRSASKMYQDCKDGSSKHTGYVVGYQWFTVYEVTPFKK